MVLLNRQAYPEALAMMTAQPPPIDDEAIAALWERSSHGRFLPDPAHGSHGALNIIDNRQQERLWILRTLTLRATCHQLVGEHEAAARFALAAASINPRMIRSWEILAPALAALGCTEGAEQARRNQQSLEQQKAAGALDAF
jgi:hypothetical protein